MDATERFWSKVEKGPDCWDWTAAMGTHGYGSFWLDGRNINAQNAAWRLVVGPIPQGLSVLHHCDRRRCVRIDHLYLGTPADNMRDRDLRLRAPVGERHYAAKVTDAQAFAIRERWIAGQSQTQLAAEFGISQTGVSVIVHAKVRRHAVMPPGARPVRGVKLSIEQVRAIRAMHPAFSYRTIGERFGIRANMVGRIVTRHAWKGVE